MDHNDFDFDEDFIEPLIEFFKQINLRIDNVSKDYHGVRFSDEYYFPPATIV